MYRMPHRKRTEGQRERPCLFYVTFRLTSISLLFVCFSSHWGSAQRDPPSLRSARGLGPSVPFPEAPTERSKSVNRTQSGGRHSAPAGAEVRRACGVRRARHVRPLCFSVFCPISKFLEWRNWGGYCFTPQKQKKRSSEFFQCNALIAPRGRFKGLFCELFMTFKDFLKSFWQPRNEETLFFFYYKWSCCGSFVISAINSRKYKLPPNKWTKKYNNKDNRTEILVVRGL